MKKLLNWRQMAMFALFAIGMLALMRIYGDPIGPMDNTEWFKQQFFSLVIAVPCFYTLGRLMRKWENKIKNNDYGDENL